jgi:hypothetical protein
MNKSDLLQAFQNFLTDESKNKLTPEQRKNWIEELKKSYSWNELSESLKIPIPTIRKWLSPEQNQNEVRIRNPYEWDKLIEYFKAFKYHPRYYKDIRKLIDVLESHIGLNQIEE